MGTRFVSLLSLAALSLNATAALASEPAVTPQPYGDRASEDTLDLSNAYEPEAVYVTRLAARAEGGNVTGSFTIENTEETLVTGLQYRIELRGIEDEDGLPYAIDTVHASIALASNESKNLLINSPLPGVPAGRYELRVQLLTAKGRSLGWMDTPVVVTAADGVSAFAHLFPGTIGIAAYGDTVLPPLSGPNVDPSGSLTLRATALNKGASDIRVQPVVELYDFNASRVALASYEFSAVRIGANESLPLDMPITAEATPGVYMAHVTLRNADTHETMSTIAQYRFVVKGADADIVSLRISNMGTHAGDWAYGTIDLAGAADALSKTTATLRVQLTDDKGVVGSIEVPSIDLTDSILSANIRVQLTRDLVGTPTMDASLLSVSGATYDHVSYAGALTPAELASITQDQSLWNWIAWHGFARISLFAFIMAAIGYGLFSLVSRMRGTNGMAFTRTATAAFLLVCFATNIASGFAAGSGGIEVLTPKNASAVFGPLGSRPIVALFINSPVHNQPNNFCDRRITLDYRVEYGVCENQIANVRVLGRVAQNGGKYTTYDPAGVQWQTVHNQAFTSDQCGDHFCFKSDTFSGTIDLTNVVSATANDTTLQLLAKYGKNIDMPDSSFDRNDRFIKLGWAHALNVHLMCSPSDLTIQKSGPTNVVRGQTLSYTIGVQASGTASVPNVIVTDPIPNGVTFLPAASDNRCSQQGSNVVCNLGTVTGGQTVQIPISFSVPTVASCSTTTIENTARVSTTAQETNTNNNQSQTVTTQLDCPNGCIEVLKETFDPTGSRLMPVAQFAFKLDGNQQAVNDANGRAIFQNVTPGTHTITEVSTPGWDNFLVTPTNGVVQVSAGSVCSAVVFKNRQRPQTGCIEIQKEGYDANNNRLSSIPSFTFRLDDGTTVQSDAQGRAIFQNVQPGVRNVTELTPAGWTQFSPANGNVTVTASSLCASMTFKNRQQPQETDVEVVKNGPSAVVSGNNATYQIIARNNGPIAAPNVVVRDPVPAGTTFVAAQSDNRCALQSGLIVCQLGTMNVNQQIALQITLNVSNQNPQTCVPGTLTNRADISSDIADPNTSNNVSSVNTQVQCPQPVVGCIDILKEAFDANNNTVTPVPSFAFSLDGNQLTQSDAQGRARFANVTPGVHTITETPLNGWTQFNVTPANGTVQVIAGTTCSAVVFKNRQQPQDADLQIQKSGPATVVRGNNVTYQLLVKNNGLASAPNVIVGDPLPAGTTFVAAQSSQNCQLQGNTVFCSLGTLSPSQQLSVNITLNVTLAAGQTCQPGSIVNQAAVQSDRVDPNLSNNQSSATTQVTCPAPQVGCIDILKEGFDAAGSRLGTIPPFTFTLDNGQTINTDTLGRARFSNVTPGQHTVVETTVNGWTLFNTTPSNGIVNVTAGNTCAAVVFKNRQQPVNADVSIVKSGPQTAMRGGNLTYSLTVTNNGPAAAQNVVVQDTFPQGLTNPTVSGQGCTVNANSLSCTIGTMQVGEQKIFTLTFQLPTIQNCQEGPVTNTASVSSQNDPNAQNNQSSVTTQLLCPTPQQADVQIQKTGPATAVRGSNVTYQLVVKNNGPVAAPNVIVGDPLPSGTTFVAAQSDSRCQLQGNSIFCNLGTMALNQQITLQITVNATLAAGSICIPGTLTNQAAVQSDLVDPNLQNNQSSATTQLTCPQPTTADVSIVKTGTTTVQRGGTISYQLLVTNNGPATATGVVVTDAVPSGLTIVTGEAGCSLTNGAISCSIGTMTSGQTRTLNFTFSTVAQPTNCSTGTVTNTGVVTSSTTDPNTANNQSSATTQLTCQQTQGNDVSIVKTGPSSVMRGENFTYTLTATNSGPATASGVVINDTLPSGLVYVTSGSGCALTNSTVSCQVGTLTSGQQKSFTITVTTPPIQSCSITTVSNTGTITSTSQDTNSANNTSSLSTQINCPNVQMGCIDIVKETFDSLGNVLTPVTQFTFTLDGTRTAVNDSLGHARFENVAIGSHTVSETLPNGWTQQLVTPAGGTVNVVAGSCATISFKNKQNTLATNDGFTISKTDGETTVEPGDSLTYTITVKNVGSTRRTNITVTDILPDEVEFQDASPNETSENGRTIRWENQTFEAGETKTYEVDVDVDDDADGTLLNTATVENISATDRTDVEDDDDDDDNDEDVEIELTKTASTSEVFPGGIIDYTVTVRNTGNDRINDLTVTDQLPADVIIIDDGDADSRNGRRLEWEIDELDEDDSETFRYRVSVPTFMVPGQIIRNEVCVDADNLDNDECESVTVIVLGTIPKTGAKAQVAGETHLTPITSPEPTDSTLPFVAVLALAGVITGAGLGFGRKLLIGF